MNIRESDIRLVAFNEGRNAGIADGISQGISQGIAQGISQGAEQAKIETAKNFLNMGLPIEQVVQGTGLSLETVGKLAKDN